MNNFWSKKKILLLALFLLILAALASSFYYFQGKTNYLIQGVPAFNVYNHFFEMQAVKGQFSRPATISALASVLGYWGDERFSLDDLNRQLTVAPLTISRLEEFLKNSGYETYHFFSAQSGKELDEIKKYVNSKNKIPVIILQEYSLDENDSTFAARVVVGLYDKEGKAIVHDYYLGNNYEISYDDFLTMFKSGARIVAAWPSQELSQKIKGPDHSKSYPERFEAMDKTAEIFHILSSARTLEQGSRSPLIEQINPSLKSNSSQQTSGLFEKIVRDNNFGKLPPAYRVYFYSSLVKNYFELNKLDEAVEVINKSVLPINNNLDTPHDGWAGQLKFFGNKNYTEKKSAQPYYLLGLIYSKKGDDVLARKNFEEALRIYPDFTLAKEELDKIK